MCGEERFVVEWNRADNSVWFDVLALSKPSHVVAWLGYPLVRRMQARFRTGAKSVIVAVLDMIQRQQTAYLLRLQRIEICWVCEESDRASTSALQ